MGFAQQMGDRLPPDMALPPEFRALFEWIEGNGFTMPSGAYPGDNLGLLGSPDDLQSERVIAVLFRVATRDQAREHGESWFGSAAPNIEDRLVPFARTGGDGSHAAFWLDDDRRQHIVHLGSEGLVCLLGQTPLDFLRLIAIGYDEISGDCLHRPTAPPRKAVLNESYRNWLTARFNVAIPETASTIVFDSPEGVGDAVDDPFSLWVRANQEKRDRETPV